MLGCFGVVGRQGPWMQVRSTVVKESPDMVGLGKRVWTVQVPVASEEVAVTGNWQGEALAS